MDDFDHDMDEIKKVFAKRPDNSQFIDIHCHCLAYLDDGPETMAESLALCRSLVDDGIGVVVATPHQLGRFSGLNEASKIREAVSILNEQLSNNEIDLTVMPGGDVRVDERICQLLESDQILTLADGGKYILLELPHEIFIDIEPLLVELASIGIQSIISHPERHRVLIKHPEKLFKLIDSGVYIQITAASLTGEFGSSVQKAAWHFLTSGWVSFVATDSHDIYGRRPLMRVAYEYICEQLGERIARQVCIENPLRILEGRNIPATGPMEQKFIDERARSKY